MNQTTQGTADGFQDVKAFVGLLGALALGGVLERHLFQTEPTDPLSLVATASLLFAVAVLACLMPAIRATRVHPVDALRE